MSTTGQPAFHQAKWPWLFLSLAWLLIASQAQAALSVVQAKSNHVINSGLAVTVTISTTSGNLLVIHTGTDASGTSTVTISDSASQTWTQAGGYSAAGSHVSAMWYRANSAAITSVTATWTGSGNNTQGATVYEVSGAATSSPLDASVNAGQNSAVTSATSGSLTTTNANDILLFGIIFSASTSAWVAGSGFTFPSGSTDAISVMDYEIVSSTQSGVTTTTTWTTGARWTSVFAAFKASAGGAACGNYIALMGAGCK